MSKRISELFGMDIYTTEGKYKGKVHDLIINVQEGRISTITTDSLTSKLKVNAVKDAEEIIKSKSISYRAVQAVGDIMLVSPTVPQFTGDASAQAAGVVSDKSTVRKLRLRR